MKAFSNIMRTFAKLICIIIIDFITLQRIVECYEMKMSVKVCWAIILFLILWLAACWLNKEKTADKHTIILSVILVICIVLSVCGTVYLQRIGNSDFEAIATYIGYKAPLLVGVSDSESRLQVLEESINLSPNDVNLNIEYANKLLEQGRYDKAEKYANTIVDNLDSNNADGYAIRGICYFYGYQGTDNEENYNTLAYNDLKKSIDLGNERIETLYCCGWLCNHNNNNKDAEEYFGKAINKIELLTDKYSNSRICANTYYFYAISRYANEGQFDDKQEKALEKAISIRPFSDSYLQLGQAYYHHDTPEYNSKAKECFDNAVQLSPNIYTHEWRGWFYANKLSNYEEAKKEYQYIINYYQNNKLSNDETINRVRSAMDGLN